MNRIFQTGENPQCSGGADLVDEITSTSVLSSLDSAQITEVVANSPNHSEANSNNGDIQLNIPQPVADPEEVARIREQCYIDDSMQLWNEDRYFPSTIVISIHQITRFTKLITAS